MFKQYQLVYLKASIQDYPGEFGRNSSGYDKKYGKDADEKTPFLFMGYRDDDPTLCVIAVKKGKVFWNELVSDYQGAPAEKYSWEE
jgi:hypothetical protein